MRVRVLGAGWYGCHLSVALLEAGHEVELHEKADQLFAGASGANPARLHQGFHYPRSKLTQLASRAHAAAFMERYGHLTIRPRLNLYAVAEADSLVDFGAYQQMIAGLDHEVVRASDFGLWGVEGVVSTAERHIVIARARAMFFDRLRDYVTLESDHDEVNDPAWDLTLDCTFCANEGAGVDRYEPCVVGFAKGPTDIAVTIMDGPFPSLYPWDPSEGLVSLSSARLTPLRKDCQTYGQAESELRRWGPGALLERANAILGQMGQFWPAAADAYRIVGYKTAIRAMPRSGADARLVEVVRVGDKALRVQAGKIDAVFRAERLVKEAIACW